MKPYGLAFLITGILLIALSGLEKILIFSSLSDRAGDYRGLIMITPNEIWTITELTLIGGIALSVVGLIIFSWKYITAQNGRIKEQTRMGE